MPIYEYVCHSCGHEFEQIQGWSEGAPSCTACGSEQVGRRLSSPAIHFKGSGWYITDSKNGQKGKNGANGVAGASEAGKEGGEEKGAAKESASESGDGAAKETSAKGESGSAAKKETAKTSK